MRSSSAGCGDDRRFTRELESRTTRLREARPNEHAITLIVETFRSPTGVRGQLTVRKPDGDLTVREVPGVDCEEVESAMALIAALMVDPLASGKPMKPKPSVAKREPPRPPAPPPPSLRLEQRLTARSAIAPGAAWGQAWGAVVTSEANRFRPSIGISAHFSRATTSSSDGSAELAFAAGQLTLCPVGLAPSPRWDLRGCGALLLGRLRGTGFETSNPAVKRIFWSSAGVELEGRYELLSPLWIGLEGAFTFPFTRERFYLEPEQTLHRVPAWGVSMGLGVGVRFF